MRARMTGVLTTREMEQCGRFLRPADRARCAAARASLRMVLARYLPGDPRTLPIAVGASGKPYLEYSAGARVAAADPARHEADDIQFNLSHTEEYALIAVSRGMSVGVDVERMRDLKDMEAILQGFFSEQEQSFVRAHEGEERTRAFFLLWTRREAAAKAVGIGLFDSFARVALPPAGYTRSGFRVALPRRAARTAGTESWWIRDLLPAPGHAGALCVERENAEPSLWSLQDE
jgi:4'-phosphopantetheinyl transferase